MQLSLIKVANKKCLCKKLSIQVKSNDTKKYLGSERLVLGLQLILNENARRFYVKHKTLNPRKIHGTRTRTR